ncbi:MAG: hypothetical protein JNL08_19610, partial [Planctomycetes bacterium]|nr:hypothetical protein [Planctomycetota bacterium]
YELLTGDLPFEPERLRTNQAEMQRILREEEPKPPSTRITALHDAETNTKAGHDGGKAQTTIERLRQRRFTSVAQWRSRLQGDLDSIVLKALHKEREHRYDSAPSLARDLQRFLDHEPIEARPPSFGYRARKFVRRFRVQVAAATVVLASLVAGGTATLIQWQRAEELATTERTARLDATQARGDAELQTARERHGRAKLLFTHGHFAEANELLRGLVSDSPIAGHTSVRIDYCRCLAASNRLADVMVILEHLPEHDVLDSDFGSYTLMRWMRECVFGNRDLGEAASELRPLLSARNMRPADKELLSAMWSKNVLDARKHLLQSAALDPTQPELWIHMSMIGGLIHDAELTGFASQIAQLLAPNSTHSSIARSHHALVTFAAIDPNDPLEITPSANDMLIAMQDFQRMSRRQQFTEVPAKHRSECLAAFLRLKALHEEEREKLTSGKWSMVQTMPFLAHLVHISLTTPSDIGELLAQARGFPTALTWLRVAHHYKTLSDWVPCENALQEALRTPRTSASQHLEARLLLVDTYVALLRLPASDSEKAAYLDRLIGVVIQLTEEHDFCVEMARNISRRMTGLEHTLPRWPIARAWLAQAPGDSEALNEVADLHYLDGSYGLAILTLDALPTAGRRADHAERRSMAVAKLGRIGPPGRDVALDEYELRHAGVR